MKKVVFFDIDGTLIDSFNGKIHMAEDVKQAIERIQQKGIYAFIASGRSYACTSREFLDFGFDGFIFMNGSVVLFQDKIIYSSPMDKIYVKELLAKFESLNIQYMLQSHVYSYLKDEYIDILKYYKRFGIYEKYLKNCYDIDSIDVYKIDILCKNKEAIDYCLSLKKTSMSVGCDLENGVFYLSSGDESKGKGIKKALEYMNIPVENSYAFGDETNDTEMLKTVGCGIAMGNASDYVKSYADKVTDSVENNGVAVGIREFIEGGL